jgi:hypothetical protein
MVLAVTLLGEPDSQLPMRGGSTPAASGFESEWGSQVPGRPELLLQPGRPELLLHLLLQHQVQCEGLSGSDTHTHTLTEEASYQDDEDSSNAQVEGVCLCMLVPMLLMVVRV